MKFITLSLIVAVSSVGYCVTNQPRNIGYAQTDSPFSIGAKTTTQLNALTPDTTGELLYCSDCTKTIVCVSSGSHPTNSVGAWVAISTAAALAQMQHCQ